MRDGADGTGGLRVVLGLAWGRIVPPLALMAALLAGGWLGAPLPV